MKYILTGGDLPELYKDTQDPTFHQDESWELAKGDGWVARLATHGEIRVYEKGERIKVSDLIDKYDTDEKLHKAEQDGTIEFDNNNWYEVAFYKDTDDMAEYLDIMSDDCVCYDFDEALHIFNDYMADEGFCADLEYYTKG